MANSIVQILNRRKLDHSLGTSTFAKVAGTSSESGSPSDICRHLPERCDGAKSSTPTTSETAAPGSIVSTTGGPLLRHRPMPATSFPSSCGHHAQRAQPAHRHKVRSGRFGAPLHLDLCEVAAQCHSPITRTARVFPSALVSNCAADVAYPPSAAQLPCLAGERRLPQGCHLWEP